MKTWRIIAALSLFSAGTALGAEGEYICKPDPVSVVSLQAPAELEVPLFTGVPGTSLKHALNATWKRLSPKGQRLVVTGCFHEGYLRLALPEIPQCAAEGCWIAMRWVVTEKPMVSAPRPCQELTSGSVAASRDPLGEKCQRL